MLRRTLSSSFYLHSLCAMALLAAILGCTARGYSGPALPESEISTVTLHKVGEINFEGIVFDGHDISLLSDNVELTAGDHNFRLHYSLEEYPYCDHSDLFCLPTITKGICEGNLSTRAGRKYLVTIENSYSNVDGRIAAKGYFDFSERSDEPNPGALACRTISTS